MKSFAIFGSNNAEFCITVLPKKKIRSIAFSFPSTLEVGYSAVFFFYQYSTYKVPIRRWWPWPYHLTKKLCAPWNHSWSFFDPQANINIWSPWAIQSVNSCLLYASSITQFLSDCSHVYLVNMSTWFFLFFGNGQTSGDDGDDENRNVLLTTAILGI